MATTVVELVMEPLKIENISYEDNEFYNWLQKPQFDGPIGMTAKFYLKDVDQVSKFREIMKRNIKHTLAETGVRLYKLFADYKSPLTFYLIEEWDTVKDLKSHCTTETFANNTKDLVPCLREDCPCQIALYKALD